MATLTNTHPSLKKAWHSLCRSSDATAVPHKETLMGEDWVVWRGPNGQVNVFRDLCPHRLAPLSIGKCEGDNIRCGYHGWVFDTSGDCVEIPALGEDATIPPRAKLAAPAGVHESHGMVFIAPEEPLTPKPTLSVKGNENFQIGDLPVITTRASAGLLADNFLDMAHFPFVHAATFGAESERLVPPYTVTRDGFTFESAYEHDFANREDPGVEAGIRPLIQRRRLTYRYIAPFHLELAIEFLDAGGTNVIGFFLTPQDADTVRIYSSLWRDDLDGSQERMNEAVDFEIAVVEEDLALQGTFKNLSLPLNITTEVHTRADKTTIELRRILDDFVEAASQ